MVKDFIRTHRKGVVIGAVILGLAVVAVSVLIIGMMFSKKQSVIGPWYNEGLHQQLRFVDENSMIISTAAGVNEAEYEFDSKSGEGSITIGGSSIDFYQKGDSIFLVGRDGETEYSKGELPVNVLGTVTTTVTTTDTTGDTTTLTITQATTEETTIATTAATTASETAAGIETGATVTPSPSPSPSPTVTPNPTPTLAPLIPNITIKIDPFLPIFGTPVLGMWERMDNSGVYLFFYDDGTVILEQNGFEYDPVPYTYDPYTGEGVISIASDDYTFTVNGDVLTLEGDVSTYKRVGA